MNRTLLQHRQRLSAINELLARMDMAASQEFEDENRQGADEGAQQDKLRMEVLTHQYWQFAVDYHAVTFRLLGEGGIIGGNTMRQIVLDLHTCGQRRSHPSAGQDWTRMLPELKFILQQCRMHQHLSSLLLLALIEIFEMRIFSQNYGQTAKMSFINTTNSI